MSEWSKETEKSFLDRALRILAVRDHSCRELERKLAAKGCPEQLASFIVARCLEWKYLDDGRFAERFAREKSCAGWGPRKIRAELMRRGIDPAAADAVCRDLKNSEDAPDQFATALELAEKKAAQGRSFASVCRFLSSRGFDNEVITKAAAQAVRRFAGGGSDEEF